MRCLPLWIALAASAATENTAAGSVLFDETFALTGREQWTRKLEFNGADLLLISVRERGAEVELSATDRSGTTYKVDSPIERGGIMAIVITPPANSPRSSITVKLSTKEPLRYRGDVQVSAQRLKTADHHAVRAWLHFMRAGQNYAQIKALRSASTPSSADAASLSTSASTEYSMAADAASAAKLPSLFAFATFHLARMTYDEQNDYRNAIEIANVAEQAMRAAQDEVGAIRALSLSAAALRDGANALKKSARRTTAPAEVSLQFAAAIERFRKVEHFHAARGEQFLAAQASNNIGLTYYLQGEYAKALVEYDRAVPIFHDIADGPNEARSIQNTALTHYELGDRRCAAGYDAALRALDRADDLQLYGDILNNAALCHNMQGNFDRALSHYEEAFRIQASVQNDLQLARTLHGMGSTYFMMGDLDTALDMYTQALARRPASKDARGRAATLNALGNIACARDRYDEAAGRYEEALTLAVSTLTRARMQLRFARCLTRAGRVAAAMGQLQEIERSGLHKEGIGKALFHLERGRAGAATASWATAAADLTLTLPLLSKYELLEEQAEALMLLAAAADASSNRAQALRYIDQGIQLGEQIRTRSNNPELRATLFAPWRRFYDLKIGLLSRDSHGAAKLAPDIALRTLQVSEAARARAMEELMMEASEPASTPAAFTERQRLLTELSEKRVQLELRQERSGADDPRAQHLLRDIAALRTRLDATGAAATRMPIVISRSSVMPVPIPEDTAVLAYWLGEEQALAWVLTKDGLDGYRLGNSRDIQATATRAHGALASSSVTAEDVDRILRDASNDFLPFARQLRQKKRWVVLADGPLHYVPFAALPLPDTNAPAIAAHEISVAPAIRLLGARSTSRRTITSALLVADPVFDPGDDRLSGLANITTDMRRTAPTAYPRLRGSAAEIERISAHLSGAAITRLVGWQANREQVLGALRSPFDLVHVATHSRVDADVPQLSSIVLSGYDQQGHQRSPWLHASELRSSRLKNALFVLSACESALGKSVGGEGLVGLSYSLLSAGARGVLASNWRVADAATVDYMDAFYGALRINPDLAAAAASASRSLINERRWREPRYWASFVAYQNEL
jgi:CHAT domain-containing protein